MKGVTFMSNQIAKAIVKLELIGIGVWGVVKISRYQYQKGKQDATKEIYDDVKKVLKKCK